MTRVFVYGTLKKGLSNSHLLENSTLVGYASTCAMYKMLSGGFPVLLKDEAGSPVSGEVYDVDAETLKRLDRLEGEGSMYNRILDTVQYENSFDLEQVELYVGNPDYWKDCQWPAFTVLNDDNLLEWHQ